MLVEVWADRAISADVDRDTWAHAPTLRRRYFGAAVLFVDQLPIWSMTVVVTPWLWRCVAMMPIRIECGVTRLSWWDGIWWVDAMRRSSAVTEMAVRCVKVVVEEEACSGRRVVVGGVVR